MITEEEIEEFVDRQWVDRRSSDDEILGLIGITNINRNRKLDVTNEKISYTNQKLDDTNSRLDELIILSGGEAPTKDILPGDEGVSLARGNNGDIISCVINGITTNAIAKEDIAKYVGITVVPGGNFDEPYVVPTSIEINKPILAIQQGVKEHL